MIEQTGSIFFECEAGCFHTSSFSDIINQVKGFEKDKPDVDGAPSDDAKEAVDTGSVQASEEEE